MTTIVTVLNKGTHPVQVVTQQVDANNEGVGDMILVCDIEPGAFFDQVVLHQQNQIIIREHTPVT